MKVSICIFCTVIKIIKCKKKQEIQWKQDNECKIIVLKYGERVRTKGMLRSTEYI